MHALTQLIVSLSSLTIAGALIFLVIELQHVRRAIEKKRHGAHFNNFHTSTLLSSSRLHAVHAGFGIYVYRDGCWHLEADLSAPGCEVTAPIIKGSFNGQVVKREATARN